MDINIEKAKARLHEAVKIFGQNIVIEVIELVKVCDTDGVYTTFEDMGMYEHAECLSYLFWED
jgi:hypothetical protein